MIEIPPVAIGAIGAALIAATVSLLGLIISKEQKTSEFRQAWIDALRSDLGSYLTQINAICDGSAIEHDTVEKKIAALSPLYADLNKATFAITLRLNPEEPHAQLMLQCMKKLGAELADHTSLNPSKIRPIEAELLSASKKLLKSEWERVRDGEPTFKIAKAIALVVVIAAVLVTVGYGVFQAATSVTSRHVPAKEAPDVKSARLSETPAPIQESLGSPMPPSPKTHP